ncbi:MAG: hypothetical protein K0S86_5352 [Geminicoccaceae bacterium]|nr:hypothetical protein [Geminicoccaceae bacterium]
MRIGSVPCSDEWTARLVERGCQDELRTLQRESRLPRHGWRTSYILGAEWLPELQRQGGYRNCNDRMDRIDRMAKMTCAAAPSLAPAA